MNTTYTKPTIRKIKRGEKNEVTSAWLDNAHDCVKMYLRQTSLAERQEPTCLLARHLPNTESMEYVRRADIHSRTEKTFLELFSVVISNLLVLPWFNLFKK